MFAALFRIIFGLIVASLVGGATQVLFALTPAELAVAGQERWLIAMAWALDAATVIAVLATPLVLLIGLFTEWQGIRSFAFYLLAGIFVALSGFAVLYSGEGPQDPTLANSYAIAAYLTTGFMAGIAYWLVSGRFAGGRRKRRSAADDAARDNDSVSEARANQGHDRTARDSRKPEAGPSKHDASRSTGTVPVTRPTQSLASGAAKPVDTTV